MHIWIQIFDDQIKYSKKQFFCNNKLNSLFKKLSLSEDSTEEQWNGMTIK